MHSTVWFLAGMALLILPNLRHIGPEKYYPVRPEQWTPQAMAQAGIETTAGVEFEPIWVKQRMGYSDEKVRVISGSATISVIDRSPVHWKFETNGASAAELEAALLYFPGWTVSVDGNTTAVAIPDSGRIQFRVPAGTHHVEIEFRRTTIRFFAEVLSLLTLLVVIILSYYSRQRT